MIKPPPAGRSRLLHEERLAEIGQPMPVPPFHPLGSRVLWSAQFAMPWIRGGSDQARPQDVKGVRTLSRATYVAT